LTLVNEFYDVFKSTLKFIVESNKLLRFYDNTVIREAHAYVVVKSILIDLDAAIGDNRLKVLFKSYLFSFEVTDDDIFVIFRNLRSSVSRTLMLEVEIGRVDNPSHS
jgi:hypothetical protein